MGKAPTDASDSTTRSRAGELSHKRDRVVMLPMDQAEIYGRLLEVFGWGWAQAERNALESQVHSPR